MTDSAPPALKNGSTDPLPSIPNILERLALLAENNPELTEYRLAGEADAQTLLAALAATLQLAAKSLSDQEARQLRKIANEYRDAVIRGRAVELVRADQDDPATSIEIAGLTIRAPIAH